MAFFKKEEYCLNLSKPLKCPEFIELLNDFNHVAKTSSKNLRKSFTIESIYHHDHFMILHDLIKNDYHVFFNNIKNEYVYIPIIHYYSTNENIPTATVVKKKKSCQIQ